jgi:hypothetical protein
VKDHVAGTALWTTTTRNAEGQYTQATQGNGVAINRGFNAQTGRISTITAQLKTLFALSNLWMARGQLMAAMG